MYEESEKKINWKFVLKKILIVVLVIVLILGFIALVTKCSRNDNNDNSREKDPTQTEKLDLKEPLETLEKAVLKALNKDNLPEKLNEVKTLDLEYFIRENYLSELKAENTVCDGLRYVEKLAIIR